MKLGFIGVGNMAQAIIEGLLKAQALTPGTILVHGGHAAHFQPYAEAHGLQVAPDNATVAASCEIVILAVKPTLAPSVSAEIAEAVQAHRPMIISLMAGVSLEKLATLLGDAALPLVRLMPNLNVAIDAGMTAYALNQVAAAQAQQVIDLFSPLGGLTELPEADFATFGALAGSAPAFVYLFIDALARAGVKHGLTKQTATEIVAQMLAGSGQMVLASEASPFDLIDKVSSPGGTTVEGILAMEAHGFSTAAVAGVDATIAKDHESD
ncbi:pyrroline-5-carboxylate reductase [Lacticaseibacillus yichunensis]|uniref:Pyrroline-5-carboxylate reductase n=1 Tax=Lacticaseibacillus yichunensis TaxID=2486015 RepID=A0ABW4CQA4_9LACO|nr:pyrroline-5-carboxylate reductase [Lacticaseibacillus yichunensis]